MKTFSVLASVLTSVLSVAAWAGAAVAASSVSYTGTYQVKLTHDVYVTTQGYNGHGPNTTHCLALTDDGSIGWPNSGYAVMDHNANTSGQFSVIGPTILIYIEAPGSDESIASYVFSASAGNGQIGNRGAFDYIQGGESYDADDARFVKVDNC